MKAKTIAGLAGILMAQSAFALSQCPANAKECGPNPFYILALGFSQGCAGKFPENSSGYKAALAEMVAENPKAYAELDTDAEFQKKLQELRRMIEGLPLTELVKECRSLLPVVAEREKSAAMGK